MLTIKLQVNTKEVKRIDVVNIRPEMLSDFEGECPYQIFMEKDGVGTEIGFVTHERRDGIVELSRKVLDKVRWDELTLKE